MKDASGALRRAVSEALEGNISYNASSVAVYDGQVLSDGDNLYILIGSESSSPRPNRARPSFLVTVLIEIIHRAEYAIDSEVLENVSEQALEILIPTVTTNGLVSQADFQFSCLQLENGNKLNLAISTTNSINRKLLTLSCRVSQLN